MSSSNIYISVVVYFLLFGILNQAVIGDDLVDYVCSPSGASSLLYQTETDMALAFLYDNTPATGYSGITFRTDIEQANTYALCRADVSSTDCQACVLESSYQMSQLCPTSSEVIIYYDHCVVLNTDVNVWGVIDDTVYICHVSDLTVSDPAPFDQAVNYMLNQLAGYAPGNTNLFAAGVMDLDETTKLYGYVQCPGSLSGSDCQSCLESIISKLPQDCTDGNAGGRIVAGTCIIRFEIYPFINT